MAEEKTLEQALQENGSLIFLDGVEKKETRWLWYPYIPLGKVTILMGDPGEGKSTFALNLAAAVTRGCSSRRRTKS